MCHAYCKSIEYALHASNLSKRQYLWCYVLRMFIHWFSLRSNPVVALVRYLTYILSL